MGSSGQSNARRFRFQEGGIVVVILFLGLLLTVFCGKVNVPAFETNANGERVRVFKTTADGEKELFWWRKTSSSTRRI